MNEGGNVLAQRRNDGNDDEPRGGMFCERAGMNRSA